MSNDSPAEAVRTAGRSSLERVSWIALGSAILGALSLRFIGLDHLPGINGDEGVYAVHARAFLQGAPLSSLRTGTNLPMNPLFFGSAVLLQAVFEPSLLSLRLAALIHSLLAIALAFLLFRRRGLGFAMVFACLVASLPIHLGYARFAWDTAALPTVLVLSLAAATRRAPYWTALAFVLGLWVHPASVFSLPLLAAPFAAHAWPRRSDGRLRPPSLRVLSLCAFALVSLAGLGVLLVILELLPTQVLAVLNEHLIAGVFRRLVSPRDALEFSRLYVELLCGPTIYRYIAGSLSDTAAWLHVSVFIGCVAPLLALAIPRLRAAQRWEELALIVGLGASVALAYVIGGIQVLRPGTERYGIFLTTPSCYVCALCVQTLCTNARREAGLRLGVAAIGVAFSISFALNHLAALHTADPHRENAFRTGAQDPKQLALSAVLRARDPKRTTVVLAQDWWVYWPVRYLADGEANVRVTIYGQRRDFRFPPDFEPTGWGENAELFAIAWNDGPFDKLLRPYALQRIAISGYEPAPILQVLRLAPPNLRPKNDLASQTPARH